MASGGGKGSSPESSQTLERISEENFERVEPILDEASIQVEDLLRTGGTGSQLPSIRRAIEAAIGASSQSQRQTSESLIRAGISGTDFQTIMAQLAQQGEFQTSQIPFQIAAPTIQAAFAQALGLPQLAISGLGQAGQIQAGVTNANTAAQAAITSAAISSAGQAASGTNFGR